MLTSAYQYLRRAYQFWRDRGLIALTTAVVRRLKPESFPLYLELSYPESVDTQTCARFPLQQDHHLLLIATCWGDAQHLSQWLAHTQMVYDEQPFDLCAVLMDPALRDQLPWSEMNVDVQVCRSPQAVPEVHGAPAYLSRAATLVFVSDRIAIQPQALKALHGTLRRSPRTAAVAARVLRPDGLQRERSVLLNSNGRFEIRGAGSDPWQPEDAFLRRADFAQGDLVAVRRSHFLRLGGFSDGWTTPEFMIADFTLRLQAHRLSTYYQPQAYALDLAETEPPQSPFASPITATEDYATFRRRWASATLWESHKSLSSAASSSLKPKRALVIDYDFPAPDRDSGSFRMVNLLQLMQELGFEITLATMSLEPRPGYVSDLQKAGIRCLYRPYVRSLQGHLQEQGRGYQLVMLCRMETANALMSLVRECCPMAAIVFDTVDLHFLRLEREALLGRARRMQAVAERAKRTELAIVAKADHTFVVSEPERNLLAQLMPGAKLSLVSNIHHIAPGRTPYSERMDLLFVGGFSHPPNLDAVVYFAEQIFPRLPTKDRPIKCLVVGADPPRRIRDLHTERLQILGHQPSLDPFLRKCRISIAPLRFGAGVKGKIHQSLAYGLPVVATSIAAEGMHLQDGESVLIADQPDAFAKAILRLYNDAALWRTLSDNGVDVIQEHFSAAAAMKTLRSILTDE